MERIYLDANATTRVAREVVEEMLPLLSGKYGNASSAHTAGREAKKYLEKARKQVARLINCQDQDQIIFTSGGTESNNFAIKGIAKEFCKDKRHIITSKVEHPAVLETCRYLEKDGYSITYLDVDEHGIINLKNLEKAITPDTALITIMAANNETGTLMPISGIKKIAAEKGVYFHTDAVQFIGKIYYKYMEPLADLVSFSSHKINGPKGVGALYIKKGTKIRPFFHGGHQEGDLRAGTENIAGIAGFGKACELIQNGSEKRFEKIRQMRDMLYKGILSIFKNAKLNGHPEKRLPNTLNISLPGFSGDSMVMALDIEGICISTGSACQAGSAEESHVLKAMGLGPERIKEAVRISLDAYNSEEEIRVVLDKLKRIKEKQHF